MVVLQWGLLAHRVVLVRIVEHEILLWLTSVVWTGTALELLLPGRDLQ